MEHLIKFQGIGTHWWIKIFDEIDNDKLLEIETAIRTTVKDFENLYSRFLETSLISKLNNLKELDNSPNELIQMLKLGESTREITQGHFNIGVGKILERMGYDKDYSFISKSFISTNEESKDSIQINKQKITIGRDTRIDLGGIGKGFLIDKINKLMKDQDFNYYFINAGGDIYATSNYDDPLEFALENPFNIQEMIGKIQIKNQGIASSAPSRRKWLDQNTKKELHHLIDMTTKNTIKEISGVYTLGENATNADIASTAIFVSPKDLYSDISDFFKIEYLVIYTDKSYIKSSGYNGLLFK